MQRNIPRHMHYSDYLQTDKILQAQFPESNRLGRPAHDEMLFIIIHQAYELWFKQLLHETVSVQQILLQPALNDNSPELQTVVHRLHRCVTILKLLVQQIEVIETMTPMDFLDFRDLLRPASGFQSVQFKMLEARLGLRYEDRHRLDYYLSQLRPEEKEAVKYAESIPSVLQLVNSWLERMPFFDEPDNWQDFAYAAVPEHNDNGKPQNHVFWMAYKKAYHSSLAEKEAGNASLLHSILFEEDPGRRLSAAACRAALFIMLYRGYPVLQLPFQLLNNLLEIDEQLSTWRYRHMNMVHRTIGTRIGTGGSTGKDYLAEAASRHYIFSELAALTGLLMERQKLPKLGRSMQRRLGFSG